MTRNATHKARLQSYDSKGAVILCVSILVKMAPSARARAASAAAEMLLQAPNPTIAHHAQAGNKINSVQLCSRQFDLIQEISTAPCLTRESRKRVTAFPCGVRRMSLAQPSSLRCTGPQFVPSSARWVILSRRVPVGALQRTTQLHKLTGNHKDSAHDFVLSQVSQELPAACRWIKPLSRLTR